MLTLKLVISNTSKNDEEINESHKDFGEISSPNSTEMRSVKSSIGNAGTLACICDFTGTYGCAPFLLFILVRCFNASISETLYGSSIPFFWSKDKS